MVLRTWNHTLQPTEVLWLSAVMGDGVSADRDNGENWEFAADAPYWHHTVSLGHAFIVHQLDPSWLLK